MALSPIWIETNKKGKEIKEHGTESFPCAAYDRIMSGQPGDDVSWHWHKEFELMRVKEDSMEVRVISRRIVLHSGEMLLINSNTLHYARAINHSHHQAFVFSPLLITGTDSSVFASNYVTPLISCADFVCYFFAADHPDGNLFTQAFQAMENDIPGYEFTVREVLSHVIFDTFQYYEKDMRNTRIHEDKDSIRMTQMLDYIHSHYAQKISLADLGRVANLSEREVLRCFQRSIGESPLQYLIRFRLNHSSEMLKSNDDKSIAEIAYECGFDSPAYYTKKFHELYHCTPRQFRHDQ